MNAGQQLVTATGDLVLGAGNATGANSEYPGLLDDVQIYNRDLAAAEVAALYNNPGGIAGRTLFSSRFDANTGATVLPLNADNTSGTDTLTITDWITAPQVSAISDLTALIEGDSGSAGGFAQLREGTAAFANANVAFINRNHNLDTDRTTSRRGFSFEFTIDSPVRAGILRVISGHTSASGIQNQDFSSELVMELSGGSLASTLSQTLSVNYSSALSSTYRPVTFDLTGTTLATGDYALSVYQTNMPGGGAYATFNGVSLVGGTARSIADGPVLVDAGFKGATFELVMSGLNPSTSYVLKRSSNLNDGFPIEVDSPRLPIADGDPGTDTFVDPSPPAGKAFYRLEQAP